MSRIFKTNLIIVFGFLLFLPIFVLAQANDLVVQFETEPLFDESGFLPGKSVIRWVKVANNSGQLQRIAAEAINYPNFPDSDAIPFDDLSRALFFIIREKGGSDLYGGSAGEKILFDFYQSGETYLSDVSTGTTKEYEFELIFPPEKENEWQAKTTSFDILIGFQGTGGGVAPGSGGGGVPLPLGLTIKNENAVYVGTTTTKITWTTSYNSTSRVIYDTQAGKFDLDDLPNYGYSFSTVEADTPANTNGVAYHEVWMSGLIPNTTYYYRCVSHASPPTISLEYSFTTSPGQISPNEIWAGEESAEVRPPQAESSGENISGEDLSDNTDITKPGDSVGRDEIPTAKLGGGADSPRFAGETEREQEFNPTEQQEKTKTGLLAGLSLIINKNTWWLWLFVILIVYLIFRTLIAKRKKKKEKRKKK